MLLLLNQLIMLVFEEVFLIIVTKKTSVTPSNMLLEI